MRSYERHQRAANFSPHTISHRDLTFRKYIMFRQDYAGEADPELPQLRKATRRDLEEWIEWMRESLRDNTVASYMRNMRAFYHWLLNEEEITVHPMARIPAPIIEESPKDVVPKDGMDHVLSFLEKTKRWRDLMLIAIIYDAGARAGELANCLLEDVDLDAGLIMLRRTKGRRPRTVPISPRAVKYIDRYLRTKRLDPEFLINGRRGRMSPGGLSHAVAHAFQLAGLKGQIAAHDVRHTSATHAYGQMTDSEMMTIYGWKNSDQLRHYADQGRVDAAVVAHRRASPLQNLPRAKKR